MPARFRTLAPLVVIVLGCTVRQDLGPGGRLEDGAVPNDVCGENGDCEACVYDGCEWCAETATCRSTMDDSCTGASAVEYEGCWELACWAHTDCESCHADSCSWCDVQGGVCIYSTVDCPLHYWYLSSDACPPANQCSTHLGCDSCLGESGCGWCVDYDECLVGGWDEPFGDTLCFDGFWTDPWSCGG